MGLLPLLSIFLIAIAIRGAPPTDAWGKEGHFMVCKIAEKYLKDGASSAVLDLLPAVAEGDLASVCSWADEVRFRYRWSSPLHYINTPGVCNYKYSSHLLNLGRAMDKVRADDKIIDASGRTFLTHTILFLTTARQNCE